MTNYKNYNIVLNATILQLENKIKHNLGFYFDCPFCGCLSKRQKTFIYGETGQFKCHKCDTSGNAYTLSKQLGLKIDSKSPEIDPVMEKIRLSQIETTKEPEQKPIDRSWFESAALYPYTDSENQILYGKLRFFNHREQRKDYRIVRFDRESKNWFFNYSGTKYLYNLKTVKNSNTIFFVEGEKCADYLQTILPECHAATTIIDGAKESLNFDPINNQFLIGKQIIILPDNDTIGLIHAINLHNYLSNLTDIPIKMLNIGEKTGLGNKSDIADWIELHGEPTRLTEHAKDCMWTQLFYWFMETEI